jgi:hypothetical protein
MPSPGGQISGMASYDNCCGWVGWGGVWHPIDLLEGYHTATWGQSRITHVPVSSRGCPQAAVWLGYARSTGCHTSPSVQDRR